jgi:hypothetical protein
MDPSFMGIVTYKLRHLKGDAVQAKEYKNGLLLQLLGKLDHVKKIARVLAQRPSVSKGPQLVRTGASVDNFLCGSVGHLFCFSLPQLFSGSVSFPL